MDAAGGAGQAIATHCIRSGVKKLVLINRSQGKLGQLVEHLPGKRQVEERVDQQGCVLAAYEPGVRQAPGAVGLQVGPATLAGLVKTSLIDRCGVHLGDDM